MASSTVSTTGSICTLVRDFSKGIRALTSAAPRLLMQAIVHHGGGEPVDSVCHCEALRTPAWLPQNLESFCLVPPELLQTTEAKTPQEKIPPSTTCSQSSLRTEWLNRGHSRLGRGVFHLPAICPGAGSGPVGSDLGTQRTEGLRPGVTYSFVPPADGPTSRVPAREAKIALERRPIASNLSKLTKHPLDPQTLAGHFRPSQIRHGPWCMIMSLGWVLPPKQPLHGP